MPQHFLCTQSLQWEHLIVFERTSLRHIAQGYLPESCNCSRPRPDTRILVFFMFTRKPFSSMFAFQTFSLVMHSPMESAIITRSSAYRISQAPPVPWRAAGWVLNLDARPLRLQTPYCTVRWPALDDTYRPLLDTKTSHSPPEDFSWHSIESVLQIDKGEIERLLRCDVFLLQLAANKDGTSCSPARHETELHFINVHHVADERVQHMFQQFHDLVCKLKATIVTAI